MFQILLVWGFLSKDNEWEALIHSELYSLKQDATENYTKTLFLHGFNNNALFFKWNLLLIFKKLAQKYL